MQWLIDIIAERVIATIGIPPVFIDRGDPAARDFTFNDFTRDSTWRDLDLSGIVPANAQGVCILCTVQDGIVGRHMYFRKKGNVNVFNVSRIFIEVAGVQASSDCTVPLDSDRFIQYHCNIGAFQIINVTVKNWWF